MTFKPRQWLRSISQGGDPDILATLPLIGGIFLGLTLWMSDWWLEIYIGKVSFLSGASHFWIVYILDLWFWALGSIGFFLWQPKAFLCIAGLLQLDPRFFIGLVNPALTLILLLVASALKYETKFYELSDYLSYCAIGLSLIVRLLRASKYRIG